MVRGVLATWDFVGEIALRVQNHPPDVGLSAGNGFLLLAMCFMGAESPSGCGIALLMGDYRLGIGFCWCLGALWLQNDSPGAESPSGLFG